jgi:hypothetical protein
MKQTRTASLVEALTNVAVGFVVAMLTQLTVFPLFAIEAGLQEHMSIATAFTVVSLLRSYALRRAFEVWRARSETRSATGLWVWWRF